MKRRTLSASSSPTSPNRRPMGVTSHLALLAVSTRASMVAMISFTLLWEPSAAFFVRTDETPNSSTAAVNDWRRVGMEEGETSDAGVRWAKKWIYVFFVRCMIRDGWKKYTRTEKRTLRHASLSLLRCVLKPREVKTWYWGRRSDRRRIDRTGQAVLHMAGKRSASYHLQ